MQEYTYLAFLEGVIMFSEQSSLCFLSNMTSYFFFCRSEKQIEVVIESLFTSAIT